MKTFTSLFYFLRDNIGFLIFILVKNACIPLINPYQNTILKQK